MNLRDIESYLHQMKYTNSINIIPSGSMKTHIQKNKVCYVNLGDASQVDQTEERTEANATNTQSLRKNSGNNPPHN